MVNSVIPKPGSSRVFGVVRRHGDQRRRMRRHEAVHDAQPRDHRDPDVHHRRPGPLRDGERDRHEQHEADLEEDGNPDDERDRRHRPVHALLTKCGDQRMGDPLRTARFGHHLAEHRPQRDDERDVAEGVPDTGLERLHDGRHRHPDGDAEDERDDDQRDERVELVPRDQDDERDDRDGGVDEKKGALDRRGGYCGL